MWDDDVDLGAYLARVGVEGPVTADVATLRRLHRAHVAAIRFENLDVMLGRPVEVGLAAVQKKLVGGQRGGYCYEHATLFGAVLQSVGFGVVRLLVRSGDPLEEPRPRSHMTLKVMVEGRAWLADVGFGRGLLEPLPFEGGTRQRQGAWEYELVTGADGAWRLREGAEGVWRTLQTITEEACYPIDVEIANYNTSTSPRSPFTQRVVVMRKNEGAVHSLIGREYTVERPGMPPRTSTLGDEDFVSALRTEFGLSLTPPEARMLVATL